MGNTFKYDAPKPCSGDCKILSLEMSLENADGSPAENANGVCFLQIGSWIFTDLLIRLGSITP